MFETGCLLFTVFSPRLATGIVNACAALEKGTDGRSLPQDFTTPSVFIWIICFDASVGF
jgi:hypothetical protein